MKITNQSWGYTVFKESHIVSVLVLVIFIPFGGSLTTHWTTPAGANLQKSPQPKPPGGRCGNLGLCHLVL